MRKPCEGVPGNGLEVAPSWGQVVPVCRGTMGVFTTQEGALRSQSTSQSLLGPLFPARGTPKYFPEMLSGSLDSLPLQCSVLAGEHLCITAVSKGKE